MNFKRTHSQHIKVK